MSCRKRAVASSSNWGCFAETQAPKSFAASMGKKDAVTSASWS